MNKAKISNNMDKYLWGNLLVELTAGDGKLGTEAVLKDENHLSIAFNFFKKQDIDAEGKFFLDAGCYNNQLKYEVKSIWNGSDINPEAEAVHYNDDLHATDYEDKFFDIIFCSHTLEHTISPLIVLNEFKRILKDDGSMIIAVPLYPGFITDEHNYVMPDGSWRHLFSRLKLKVIDYHFQKDCGNYHLKKEELK